MTRFRTRRMEPDDGPALNDAYNKLGVNPYRPLQEMERIWRGGPGGPVKSWLIEADEGAGWRLIGHHGLCPLRFTLGRQDLVFAKTVNSFLLPEFRRRFVYLRFEKECLAQVEHSFDATYTLAELAVKMRAGLGYDTSVPELDFEQGLRRPEKIARLLMRLAWRLPQTRPLKAGRWLPGARSSLLLRAMNAHEAPRSPFFDTFWDDARETAGLAPRRDAADLAWRFWDAPGGCTTFTHCWPCGTRGYGIVATNDGLHYRLEDIFLNGPNPSLLAEFLEAIQAWCADQDGLMLSFMTTPESQPPPMLAVYQRKMAPSGGRHAQHVSRRLTALGRQRIGPHWPALNITALVAMA